MFRSIRIKKFTNSGGSLLPIYLNKLLGFNLKRFFILNGKKNTIRGKHAHKKCTQIFIPVRGKIELTLIKKNKKKLILNPNSLKIIKVPPLTWCEIKFIDNNCVVIVLCDTKFSEKEYIRKFKNFSKFIE